MLNYAELIVYLWLTPVFLFILLPVVAAPIIISVERVIVARRRKESAIYAPMGATLEGDQENRMHPRLATEGISAYISDGTNCYPGKINDISPGGVMITNPGNAIAREADSLGILMNCNGKCFPIQVKPLWKEDNGQEENIGAEIIDNFWNWDEFANAAKPEKVLA